jgi:regulator of protease activity HflC (stomatin/prohibitin superfamily)
MTYRVIKTVAILAIVGITLLVIASGYQQVDAGHRGIGLTFGAVDINKSYAEGAHIVMPMVQEVVQMDIRVAKYEKVADSASKDLQTVTTEITVNHKPDAEKVQIIFKELGRSYENTIIAPAVEEVVKQVTANYNAEELITKRPQVKSEITSLIKSRLLEYNLIVVEVSITDFQFAPAYAQAIENKVKVEQQVQKAKLDVLQVEQEAFAKKAFAEGEKFKKIQEAEATRESAILVAEGQAIAIETVAIAEANAVLIRAEADADRIDLLADAVRSNPDLLTLEFIDQWNGKFPDTYLSSSGEELSMLLGIPNIQNP